METEYLFALTNPGTEKALKLEVESMGLGWRLSYQRRGFVTFKGDAPFSLAALDSDVACARRLCLSLGKSTTRDEAVAKLIDVEWIHHAHFQDRKMQGVIDDNLSKNPEPGCLIGTVVELGEGEFWSGVHRHGRWKSPYPAGDAGIVMPERSPSRAWLKLEEAVRFLGLDFTPKDVVVELGCAPGGVVLALLDRGVSVIGVDPAKMADVVMEKSILNRDETIDHRAWFWHCRKPAALVSKRDLGQGVSWFMSDMNQSPEVVLKECARFRKMAPSIRGVLVTLKLTDPAQVVEKDKWFAALRAMGFKTMRLQQLSVHHKELVLLAMA
ncbi:MAG: SAM-dependent methyltransferase [Verrucomicrobiota bacterium]